MMDLEIITQKVETLLRLIDKDLSKLPKDSKVYELKQNPKVWKFYREIESKLTEKLNNISDKAYVIDELQSIISGYIHSDTILNRFFIKQFIYRILHHQSRITFLFKLQKFDYHKFINIENFIQITSGSRLLKRNVSKNNDFYVKKDSIYLLIRLNGKNDEITYKKAITKAKRFIHVINFLNERKNYCYLEELQNNAQVKGVNCSYEFDKSAWQTEEIFSYLNHNNDLCFFDPDKEFECGRWIQTIMELVYPERYPKFSELKLQILQSIDWVGTSILEADPTKAFLEIMIALDTLLEQDSRELKQKAQRDSLGKQNYGIKDQLVFLMNKLSIANGNREKSDKAIRRAYKLRSQIVHRGIHIQENTVEDEGFYQLLKIWQDHIYTIICSLLFDDRFNKLETKYDLWKKLSK